MDKTNKNQAARGDSLQRAGSEVPTPRTDNLLMQIKLTPEYTKEKETDRDRALYLCRQLERENRALREGCAKIAASIGNGSAISPDASVDFLTNALADEVKLVCHDLRQQMVGLRREIQHQKNRADAHAGLPNVRVSESARENPHA